MLDAAVVDTEVEDSIAALRAGRGALAEFGEDVEAEFGRIGEALGRAGEQLVHIGETAARLGAFMRGEDENSAAVYTHQLFKKSGDLEEASLELSDEVSGRLWEICEQLESMSYFEQEFSEVLMMFWYVTTGFRVEAASLGDVHREKLLGLAASMTDLHALLRHHIGGQFTRLNEVAKVVRRTTRDLAAVRAANRKRLDDTRRRIQEDLRKLDLALAPGRSFDLEVNSHLQNASASVCNVIMALQLQDIVKQKLQHVAGAIDGMVLLASPVEVPDSGTAQPSLNCAIIHHTASVQLRQLDVTMGEVSDAEKRIVQGLKHLMASGASALDSCRKLQWTVVDALQRSRTASSFVENLSEMNRVIATNRELARSVGATVEQIRAGVLDGLPEVSRLAIQLRLVGLNAQVLVAHLPDGNAAAAHSAHTRSDSNQMQQIVQDFVAQVQITMQKLVVISDSLNEFLAVSAQDEHALSRETQVARVGLEDVGTTIASGLVDIDREFRGLRSRTQELLAGIAFPAQAALRIGNASDASERLQQATLPYSQDYLGDASVRQHLDALRLQYSIEDERLLHDEVLVSAGFQLLAELPPDSLFEDSEKAGEELLRGLLAAEAAQSSQSTEDLGDNVELF